MDPSQNSPQSNPTPQQNQPPVNSYQPPQQNPTTQQNPTVQQSPAPQQNYPPVNPQHYPPQQYPAPHQTYPSQQGYPQYGQQPQDPKFIRNTNNVHDFDQGGFQCYKVCLWVLVALFLLEYGFGCKAMATSPTVWDGLIQITINLPWMILAFVQFLAMKDRNLQTAKIALIGFICCVFVRFVVYVIPCLLWAFSGSILPLLIILVQFSIQSALALIGSIKVYERLKINEIKSASDLYQNYNTV